VKSMMIVVLALSIGGACGGKKGEPAAGSGSGSAAPVVTTTGSGSAAPTPTPTPEPGSGSDSGSATAAAAEIPTEEDFEDDAATKITSANVEAQVKALETDLDIH